MIKKYNNIERNFTNTNTTSIQGFNIEGEYVLDSPILIPANTFKDGDIFTIEGIYDSSGATFVRFYVGSATTIATSTQLMVRSFNSSGFIYQTQRRTLHVVKANGDISGTSPNRGTILYSTTDGGNFDEFRSGNASILPIDWTTDKYIFSTVEFQAISPQVNKFFWQYSLKIWTH
jgi:hypothetical protein